MSLTNHLKMKNGHLEGLLKTCIYASSDHVISKIKMKSLLQLYKSSIIPSLLYGCETWTLTTEQEKYIYNIQLTTLRRILKVPNSTPIPAILGETGEIPITLEIEFRKLKHLWKILNTNDQDNDIAILQKQKYNKNKNSIINNTLTIINKYNI